MKNLLFLYTHPQLTPCRPDRRCLISSARRRELSSLSFAQNDDGPEPLPAQLCWVMSILAEVYMNV